MTSVVFYFQVHQPFRLLPQTRFDLQAKASYFDDGLNRYITERVAERCYLPTNQVLLDAIERTNGRFRCSFSLSGTALTQLEKWSPEALDSFIELAQTGACEILCETAYHSLASITDAHELEAQVNSHRQRIEDLFGTSPKSFRNTELVFDNELAKRIEGLGFEVLIGEGADRLLGWRSPRYVYRPKGTTRLKLLLRDYLFSDDIAFRFSNPEWESYPLMADTFAGWLKRALPEEAFIGLFMDYETFGEHQSEETGILEFLTHLPEFVLAEENLDFQTPLELARNNKALDELDAPDPISWADEKRDLSAWLANGMQIEANKRLYDLAPKLRRAEAKGGEELMETWRKLTTSDHVYYMYTRRHEDGNVHEYFTPYDSPHDSYLLFMNVLEDLERRVDEHLDGSPPKTTPKTERESAGS